MGIRRMTPKRLINGGSIPRGEHLHHRELKNWSPKPPLEIFLLEKQQETWHVRRISSSLREKRMERPKSPLDIVVPYLVTVVKKRQNLKREMLIG
jgi:hypothetical protein